MSVESTQWRFVGRQILTGATLAGVLDAVFTLGTSNTYYDGSSRTPGTGSAGTWSRFQNTGVTEAIHVTPAVSPLNHRIILATRSAAPTPSPTMCSPDTFLANTIIVNIIKNAGAFNSWNASSPFTSGQTFGYWRCYQGPSAAAITSFTGSVNLWESRDCVAVSFLGSTAQGGFFAGALLDPETTETITDSETDNKLYGIITFPSQDGSGGASFASDWLVRDDGNGYRPGAGLRHSTSASQSHAGVFQPNSSNILTMNPMILLNVGSNSTSDGVSMYTRSGRFVRLPIVYRDRVNSHVLGRLREIYLFPDSRIPQRILSGSNPLGYIFAPSDSSNVNSVLLEH